MKRLALGLAALTALAPRLGAQQARVDSLASAYWEAQLDRYPEMATIDGFAGPRNDRLVDLTPAAFVGYDARLLELQRAAATVDTSGLTPPGVVTLRSLQGARARDRSLRVCRTELWSVDQQGGLQVTLPDLDDGPAGPVVVNLPATRVTPPVVEQLVEVLRTHPGVTEVRLRLRGREGTTVLRVGDGFRVSAGAPLYADLKQLLGPGCLNP